ncbi:alpha/beta hydrolase [Colwelliaceae bacterium 6441]
MHYYPENEISCHHCYWHLWQQYLASQGFESIAISLPGHGRSYCPQPVERNSLSFYVKHVEHVVNSFSEKSVIVGHSMGGAIGQWYLNYVGDVPAFVSVAGWTSHDTFRDCIKNTLRLDPLGFIHVLLKGPMAMFRTADLVKSWFLTDQAAVTPKALKAQLCPESEVVLFQDSPKYWTPSKNIKTPNLWLIAQDDAIMPPDKALDSSLFYKGDSVFIPNSNHDVMLDAQWKFAIEKVMDWLKRI